MSRAGDARAARGRLKVDIAGAPQTPPFGPTNPVDPPPSEASLRRRVRKEVLDSLQLSEGVTIDDPTAPGTARDSRQLIGPGKPNRAVAVRLRKILDSSPPLAVAVHNNLGCAQAWLFEFEAAQDSLRLAAEAHDFEVEKQRAAANLALLVSKRSLLAEWQKARSRARGGSDNGAAA